MSPLTHLLALFLVLPQGSVLTVDDDGGADFTDLQAAVDAALPGDVVLVRDGDYGLVTVAGKGIDLVAETGERMRVQRLHVRDVPAGERVLVRRLDVVPFGFSGSARVSSCAGSVWLEDCTFEAISAPLSFDAGLDVLSSSDVVLLRSRAAGGPGVPEALRGRPGLSALVSNVAVHGGELTGGEGICPGIGAPDGGPGVAVHGGTLLLSGATVSGGQGADACTVSGVCHSAGGDGGTALVLDGGSPLVHLLDTALVPGAGGAPSTSPPCISGSPGGTISRTDGTIVPLAGSARLFESSSPAREGTSTTLAFGGLPGELALTGWSLAPAHFPLPALAGWLHVAPVQILAHGILDGTGALQVAVPIAPLPPSLEGVTVLQQPAFVGPGPSAVLGPASTVTILDASL